MTTYLLLLTAPDGRRYTDWVAAPSPEAALAAYGITNGTAPDGTKGQIGANPMKGKK